MIRKTALILLFLPLLLGVSNKKSSFKESYQYENIFKSDIQRSSFIRLLVNNDTNGNMRLDKDEIKNFGTKKI